MKYCPSCGVAVEEGVDFCSACGQPVSSAAVTQEPVVNTPQPAAEIPPEPPRVTPAIEPQQTTQICSIFEIYGRVSKVLFAKPILLWGISLMFTLISFLAFFFCLLPIIYLPVVAVLEVGMISVFLAGYRGQKIESAMLFKGFDDFKRFAGGMLWMTLWVLIWSLIPFAGFILAIIKAYSYRFVPYLLLTQPDLSASDTLKRSMEMTSGYKGKMFGADILVGVIVGAAMIILGLLGLIPAIGGFFIFLLVILVILCIALLPLFMGLISAAFYDEIEKVR